MAVETLKIAPDDPCLAGHFPDHPLVPGAVLLDWVVATVQTQYAARVTRVRRCRFLQPLHPGQTCSIALDELDDGHVRFLCSHADQAIARGKLRILRDSA